MSGDNRNLLNCWVLVAALGIVLSALRVSYPVLIAHRGDASVYTEESLSSFIMAAQKGSPYVDMDMQVSSNGVLYVMHDATVDRTTNGTGTLTEMTSTQINALRLNDGSRVPHLVDVLDTLKPYNVEVSIEIKSMVSQDNLSRLCDLTRAFGASRVNITSFSRWRLDNYANYAPKQTKWLNMTTQQPLSYFSMYDGIALESGQCTPEYAKMVHDAGKKIYAWSPNTELEWNSLTYVDGIVTDSQDAYRAWASGL